MKSDEFISNKAYCLLPSQGLSDDNVCHVCSRNAEEENSVRKNQELLILKVRKTKFQ